MSSENQAAPTEAIDEHGDDRDFGADLVFDQNRKYILGEGAFCYAHPSITFVGGGENAIIVKITIVDDEEPETIILEKFCNSFIVLGIIASLSSSLRLGFSGLNATAAPNLSMPGEKKDNLKMIEACIDDLKSIHAALGRNMK